MLRTFTIFLSLTIWAFTSVHAAFPGVEWEQESGRWKLLGDVPKSLDQPGSEAHESASKLMAQARIAQEKGSQWTALGLYDDVVDDYPNSVYAPEAHYQRGMIYIERHQFKNATAEFNEIIKRYPEYPNFNQVIAAQYSIGEQVQDGARPYYWGVIPGFREYQLGVDAYEAVVQSAPYSEYAPLALMNAAIVAIKEDKQEEAIDALDRLINNYPGSILSADAYLTLAQTYASLVQGPEYDQEATRQALSYYSDYMILFPQGGGIYDAEAGLYYMRETLAKSKYKMGDFYYLYRNNSRAALTFYNEAITVDPNSAVAVNARTQIDKIKAGIKAPMTPIDWIFGRYQRPSEHEYLEQSEVDNNEDEAFQIESTEAFMETPGAEAVEEFSPGEPPQEFVGEGAPLLEEPFVDEPPMLEPVEDYQGNPEMVQPGIGPEYEEGVLQPYQAPGPGAPEQQDVDKFQEEEAANPNLPAGDQ